MSPIHEFWTPGRRRGAAAWTWPLLLPGEALFRGIVRGRATLYERGWARCERAPVPVLSIGGIEAGGVGKTPLVAELLRMAAELDLRPAVVTRGYGGSLAGLGKARAHRVPDGSDPDGSGLAEDPGDRYGDEPVWLAERARSWATGGVWVARRRLDGARAAAAAGARLVLLDDGLQHRRICRDGEIVSLAGTAPLANGHLLPAGPLREPPAEGLQRAHCVILSQADPEAASASALRVRPFLRAGAWLFSWRSRPGLRAVLGDPPGAGEAVLLVAAIAHPERLLSPLRELGHDAARSWFYPDHHRFRASDLRHLRKSSGEGVGEAEPGLALVTTEKDWIRMRGLLAAEPLPGLRIALLTQALIWNEPEAEPTLSGWMREVTGPGPRGRAGAGSVNRPSSRSGSA